jgi:hypothetical protein
MKKGKNLKKRSSGHQIVLHNMGQIIWWPPNLQAQIVIYLFIFLGDLVAIKLFDVGFAKDDLMAIKLFF